MAELEKRLKRRGVREDHERGGGPDSNRGDKVFPETANSYQSHVLSSTSSQSSDDSSHFTLPPESSMMTNTDPFPSPSRTMGATGVVRMIRLSLKPDTLAGGPGETSPSKGKYKHTTVLTSHEEPEREDDPGSVVESALTHQQAPPPHPGIGDSREESEVRGNPQEYVRGAIPVGVGRTLMASSNITLLKSVCGSLSSSSPPNQPVVSSPNQPAVSSPPNQPMISSPSKQPVVSSPPNQPAVTSAPNPAVTSPPSQPAVSSPPNQQTISSPKQPMVTSPPNPGVSSPPNQPAIFSPINQPPVSFPVKPPAVSSTHQQQQSSIQTSPGEAPFGVLKGASGVKELARVFSSKSKEDGTVATLAVRKVSVPLRAIPEPSTEKQGRREARKCSTEMDKQRVKQEVLVPGCCGNTGEATAQEGSVADEKTKKRTDAQKPCECTSDLPVAQVNSNRQGEEEKKEREGDREIEGGGGGGGGGESGKANPMSFYMNVFDDDNILKSLPSKKPVTTTATKEPKKPVPTPRKSISEGSSKLSHHGLSQPNSSSQEPAKKESKKVAIQELATEIDLLHHVVSVPSLGEDAEHPCGEEVPGRHTHITRTTSTIPTNIRRRTTPKAQKELRKGVVTDGSITSNPDAEDYISMSPTESLLILSSSAAAEHRHRSKTVAVPQTQPGHNHRNRTESTNSTQSGHYLKILPNTTTATIAPQQMTSLQSTSSTIHSQMDNDYMPMSSPHKHTNEPTVRLTSEPIVKFREPKLMKQKTSPLLLSPSPAASKTSPTSVEQGFKRTQGFMFARENRDSVQSAKYSTADHPFLNRVVPSQRDSSDGTPTYIQFHEYVDIDPEEIEVRAQRIVATPPKVPPRPYVMPPLVTGRAGTKRPPYKTLMTFLPHKRDSTPPPPPPKTDSLLREQGALPPLPSADPNPYLHPVPTLKGRSRTTLDISSPSRSRAKDIIKALKREAFTANSRGPPPVAPLPWQPTLRQQKAGVFQIGQRADRLYPEEG